MRAGEKNFKNNKKMCSLIQNVLLRIFFMSISIVLILSFFSYLIVYRNQTEERLRELKFYVYERVRTDSQIFQLAEDNLEIFAKEYMCLYLSDIEVTADEFWSYYFLDDQGVTRMNRKFYDGIYTEDGNYIYGMSSFIGNNQSIDNPDLQRRLLLAFKVLVKLGPAWVNRFANLHVVYPENAVTIFWPGEPWGLNARADLPMNELGVIKSVNKKENTELKAIWSGLYYYETAEEWVITYMDPVEYGGNHLVTPALDVYLTDLMLRLIEDNDNGIYNFIIKKDGYLIAHPSDPSKEQKWMGQLSLDRINIPSVKISYQLIQEKIGEDFKGVQIIKNEKNDNYLIVGQINGPDWFFVNVLPMEIIHDDAHAAAIEVFIEGMLILSLILVIVYFVIRYQAEKPLKQLSYAAEAIGRGEYTEVAEEEIKLPVNLKNEIGLLSTRFIEMAKHIKDCKENLEKIVEERTKALEKANSMLREMSLLDGLTGIHNRRSFDRSIARVFADAKEGLGTFSIMMADIDLFKNYNDKYGHGEGDRVLKVIAKTFKEYIREEDRAFRYGGEEFVVIFNHADAQMVKIIAERISKVIDNLGIPHSESPYGFVTISGGVQEYNESFTSPEELVKSADKKLYLAKNKGRNRLKF